MSSLGPTRGYPAEYDPHSYTGPTAPAQQLPGHPGDHPGSGLVAGIPRSELYGFHFRLASSLASTNATQIHQGGAAFVFNVWAANVNAALRFIHLYDQTTAPNVGTDVPILTIPIPVSNGVHSLPLISGVFFRVGIGMALTTDAAATNLAVAAGDILALGIIYVPAFGQ